MFFQLLSSLWNEPWRRDAVSGAGKKEKNPLSFQRRQPHVFTTRACTERSERGKTKEKVKQLWMFCGWHSFDIVLSFFYRYFIMCLNVYLHHSPPPAPLVLAVKTPRQFTYTSHVLKIFTVEKYRIKNLKIMHLINHHSHNIFINRIVMDSCHS